MVNRKAAYVAQQKIKQEKNPEGRPPRYKTAKQLDAKVDSYFEQCKITNERPIIMGLILHLGFESRDTFYKLKQYDKFRYSINRASAKIQAIYETALLGKNAAGPIFALKNFGWVDDKNLNIGGQVDNKLQIEIVFDSPKIKTKE